MTNGEYRKSRGTDKAFTTTPEQALALWKRVVKQQRVAAGLPPDPPERKGRSPWRTFKMNP